MNLETHPAFQWVRLLPTHVVVEAARCGPLGRVRKGPGTAGTAGGLGLYAVTFYHFSLVGQVLGCLLLAYLAIAFCGEAERRLQKRDPGEIVLDEVAAVPLCFIGLTPLMEASGHVWAWILAGFVLFRIFDILKPFGIARLQHLPGGLGVVADDLAAGAVVAAILHIAVRFV